MSSSVRPPESTPYPSLSSFLYYLSQTVATARSFFSPSHRAGKGAIIGFLKVGYKKLFVLVSVAANWAFVSFGGGGWGGVGNKEAWLLRRRVVLGAIG